MDDAIKPVAGVDDRFHIDYPVAPNHFTEIRAANLLASRSAGIRKKSRKAFSRPFGEISRSVNFDAQLSQGFCYLAVGERLQHYVDFDQPHF